MRTCVWVVSELYYPEATSTGYFLTKIAEGLSSEFEVRALCSQPTYSARGIRAPRKEAHNGVSILRCRGTTFSKDKLPLRALNILSISAAILWEALRRFKTGDVVLVVTNPPLLPFVVSLAAKVKCCRLILLIHDVYPEALVASGIMASQSLPARLISSLSRWLYREASEIVVLGRDMAELVRRKMGSPSDKIVIIPNWADVEEIRPVPKQQTALSRSLGLNNRFVVQYSGNMGRTHDLETLLEVARSLENEHKAHFVFIGWGAKRRWMEDQLSRRPLANVTLLPNRPRQELADALNACDIAVVSLTSGMAGVSVPSRMYNIMAAGKPVLAATDSESELALVVEEEGIGWVVPPGAKQAMQDAIASAINEPTTLQLMGERARSVAKAKYTLEAVIAAYSALIRGAASQPHA